VIRPVTLVGVYFLYLIGYGAVPIDISEMQWATLNRIQEIIGVLAGLSFAFHRHPLDKAAMAVLVIYLVGLVIADPFIDYAHGGAIVFVGAVCIGWLLYIKWKAPPLPGYETGLDKDELYRNDGDISNKRGGGE